MYRTNHTVFPVSLTWRASHNNHKDAWIAGQSLKNSIEEGREEEGREPALN